MFNLFQRKKPKLIHYIYIDRSAPESASVPDPILKLKERYYSEHKNCPIKINIWGYRDILGLAKKYNPDLANLVCRIDLDFAAGVADVGRVLLMYYYGGIYHDAHVMIGSPKKLKELIELLDRYDFLLERHPKRLGCGFMLRNKFMAASEPGLIFFQKILERQLNNLRRIDRELSENPEMRHSVWRELGVACLFDELELGNADRIRKNKSSSEYQAALEKGVDYRDIYYALCSHEDISSNDYDMLYFAQSLRVLYLQPHYRKIRRVYTVSQSDHWSERQKVKAILKLS